jgi:FtsH-binding integral membrane protein
LDTESGLARIGGLSMLGVFAINVYIGLYDTNLSQISPQHEMVNWVIAAADLIAALFLLVKPRNMALKILGGIVWPVLYIGTLAIDVETRLCLGAPSNTCLASVSDAYQYLILGSAGQEWVLWPYTIRLGITLAVITFVLSVVSLYFRNRTKKVMQTVPQGSQPPPSNPTGGPTR